MSEYPVSEATSRADLDLIVNVIWAAMDGTDPSHPIFFPVFGPSRADRKDAVQSSKDRVWDAHNSDPSSHWIFVREHSSGQVLGGCQWRIYTENPFLKGTPTIEALWWPEGEGRWFASEVVRQCYTPRMKWMARPHVGMSLMCVDPQFQRRGVGRLLMEWGVARIDSLGLESFIEATDMGVGLYSQYGYRPVKAVNVDVRREDASEEWKELLERLMPVGYTAMWRPSGGVWKDEEPQITWDERLKAIDG